MKQNKNYYNDYKKEPMERYIILKKKKKIKQMTKINNIIMMKKIWKIWIVKKKKKVKKNYLPIRKLRKAPKR